MRTKLIPKIKDHVLKKKDSGRNSFFGKIKMPDFSDSTYFIAIFTAVFYMVVSGYYVSYFNRLSLPLYTLDLPFSFYLFATNSILFILFTLFTIAFSIYIAHSMFKEHEKNKNKKSLLFIIFILFLMILAIFLMIFAIYIMLDPIRKVTDMLAFLILSCFLFAFGYRIYKEKKTS